MSRAKVIVGLADEEVGNKVWNVVSAISANSSGHVGFFGAAATTSQVLAASSNTTSIVNALVTLGLARTS